MLTLSFKDNLQKTGEKLLLFFSSFVGNIIHSNTIDENKVRIPKLVDPSDICADACTISE